MFAFAPPRTPRRPSLTPMVDVVFLLLIFFMLVSRFGIEDAIPLRAGGAEASYSGPPRLVEIGATELRLNGVPLEPRPLLVELVRLTRSGEDIVVLQPMEGASVQRLIDVMTLFGEAGFSNLAVLEGPE